jgi:hypothetical protein
MPNNRPTMPIVTEWGRSHDPFAIQKVEGSSPFIRSERGLGIRALLLAGWT